MSETTASGRRHVGRPSNAELAEEFALFGEGALSVLPDTAAGADGLTPRQRLILQVVRRSVHERGFPPSVRELATAVGLASPSSVAHQLKVLEGKGFIRRDPNRPRTIEVILPGAPPDEDPGDVGEEAGHVVQVPLVGRIAAGSPILAEQHVDDMFAMPEQVVGHGTVFMLEVHGDSMVDAAICDGDWVIVRQQQTADNGDIVAALLGDEATVKTLRVTDDHVWLMPHNSAYEPIDGTESTILGKVVAVLRRI